MHLTASQDHVIAHLAAGYTIADAAQAAGIHRNTIGLWRRTNPAFSQALTQARYDRALHFRDLAEEHVELAIATIHYLLSDLATPPSIRLKAALALLKECTTPPPPPPATAAAEPSNGHAFVPHPEPAIDPALCTPPPAAEMHNSAQSAPEPYRRPAPKTGRNDSCPCGSGQKFKRCCLSTMASTTASTMAA